MVAGKLLDISNSEGESQPQRRPIKPRRLWAAVGVALIVVTAATGAALTLSGTGTPARHRSQASHSSPRASVRPIQSDGPPSPTTSTSPRSAGSLPGVVSGPSSSGRRTGSSGGQTLSAGAAAPMPGAAGSTSIQAAELSVGTDSAWALMVGSSPLLEQIGTSGQAERRVPVSPEPVSAVVTGSGAWTAGLTNPSSNSGPAVLREYDLSSGAMLATDTLPDLSGVVDVAVSGSTIAVVGPSSQTTSSGLVRVSASSAGVLGTTSLSGVAQGVAPGVDGFWVASAVTGGGSTYTVLENISASTGQIVTSFQVPDSFMPEATTSSAVWGIQQGTGQVLELNASNGKVVARLVLSSGGQFATAASLALAGTSVWIAASSPDGKSNTLFQADSSSGQIRGTEQLSDEPLAGHEHMVSEGKTLWILMSGNVMAYSTA